MKLVDTRRADAEIDGNRRARVVIYSTGLAELEARGYCDGVISRTDNMEYPLRLAVAPKWGVHIPEKRGDQYELGIPIHALEKIREGRFLRVLVARTQIMVSMDGVY